MHHHYPEETASESDGLTGTWLPLVAVDGGPFFLLFRRFLPHSLQAELCTDTAFRGFHGTRPSGYGDVGRISGASTLQWRLGRK
jgi:hypothetical protein